MIKRQAVKLRFRNRLQCCSPGDNGFPGAATPRRGREPVRGNGPAWWAAYITDNGPA